MWHFAIIAINYMNTPLQADPPIRLIMKQAGFAVPHSSLTIGLVGLGLGLGWGWVGVRLG